MCLYASCVHILGTACAHPACNRIHPSFSVSVSCIRHAYHVRTSHAQRAFILHTSYLNPAFIRPTEFVYILHSACVYPAYRIRASSKYVRTFCVHRSYILHSLCVHSAYSVRTSCIVCAYIQRTAFVHLAQCVRTSSVQGSYILRSVCVHPASEQLIGNPLYRRVAINQKKSLAVQSCALIPRLRRD